MAEKETIDSEAPAREFCFAQAVLSDVGLKREENQDSYGYAHTDRVSFYLVADGMGGARGGGTASALAIDTILRNAFDGNGDITEDSLRSAIELANEVIFERSREDLSLTGMGTTLVALAIQGRQAIVAHVGDSRIYFARNGELTQLTRDHTLVQELVESGAIKPEEAAHHPIAHMLTRSLGPAGTVQADVRTVEFDLELGDRFLLCSDGMYNLVEFDEIAELFGKESADEAAQRLLDLVLERGASDNTTIEIIHVHDITDQSVDFSVPETGKIRVVTSGEVPDFAPTEEEQYLEGERFAESEEIVESVPNPASFVIVDAPPPVSDDIDSPDELPAEELHDEDSDLESSKEPQILEHEVEANLDIELESSVEKDYATDSNVEVLEPLVESTAQSVPVPGKSFHPAPLIGTIVFLFIVGILSAVIMSDPAGAPEQQKVASTITVTPGTLAATTIPVPVPSPSPENTFGVKPPIFDDGIEALQAPAAGSTPMTAPSIDWPNADAAGQRTETVVQTTTTTLPITRTDPAEIAPQFQDVLARASSRSVPPIAFARPQSTTVAPINWAKEQEAREELQTQVVPPVVAAPFLSDQEKQEVLSRKVDVRESVADLDMKIAALSARTRDELDALYSQASAQLTNAQKALDELKGALELSRSDFRRWKERTSGPKIAVASLASELAVVDSAVRIKKQEYDQVLFRYRAAVEAYGADPQNMSLVSEMGTLAREQKTKQAELEQALQTANQRGLQQSMEKLISVGLSVEDLEVYVKRLSRHLGFIRGAQPNIANANQQLLDRTFRERERLTTEFDRLNIQMSEYAENEIRRVAVTARLQ